MKVSGDCRPMKFVPLLMSPDVTLPHLSFAGFLTADSRVLLPTTVGQLSQSLDVYPLPGIRHRACVVGWRQW